jgi:3-oxoacyl-[acyl-carrier-protein] synthase-1
MVTSVGFNAASSCAALRAGIRNVSQTNLWDAETGSYLPAGKVMLPHWWVGLGKLADLVTPAILECFEAAKPIPPEEIPVLIGVAPPDRPFRIPDLEEELLVEIEHRFEFRLHAASSLIARDHVAVAIGLRVAGELIGSNRARCVVVAAVDSLIQQDLVNYYMSRQRVLTPKYSNGFSVGEAGSAVLVTAVGAGYGGLHVLGIGTANELAAIESEEPFRAEGLTSAIRDAFSEARLTIREVQYRITDLNGEHYKFKEMTMAMMRFERQPKPKLFELWHPVEYIGDVGAAISPLVLGLALHAGQHRYGIGPTALCTFGNDNGERAAIVVRYQGGSAS